MVWANGSAPSSIPAAVKRTIRDQQGNRCATYDPRVCTGNLDEFDHIVNLKAARVARADANHLDLLQGLCAPCHKVKTQAEALAGRNRGRRAPTTHLGLAP